MYKIAATIVFRGERRKICYILELLMAKFMWHHDAILEIKDSKGI